MKRRQQITPKYRTEYITLQRGILNKCRRLREEEFNEKCAEIERMSQKKENKRNNRTNYAPIDRVYKIK